MYHILSCRIFTGSRNCAQGRITARPHSALGAPIRLPARVYLWISIDSLAVAGRLLLLCCRKRLFCHRGRIGRPFLFYYCTRIEARWTVVARPLVCLRREQGEQRAKRSQENVARTGEKCMANTRWKRLNCSSFRPTITRQKSSVLMTLYCSEHEPNYPQDFARTRHSPAQISRLLLEWPRKYNITCMQFDFTFKCVCSG